jgi:tyrosinase
MLPDASQVDNVLTLVPYLNFRPSLEVNIHNPVHSWIGGSAVKMSSPNDPAFFLLHCNVDRLWAMWQARHPGEPFYQSDGPGHGLNDPLVPWAEEASPPTPGGLLDHTALGYTYDTDIVQTPDQIMDLTIGAPGLQGSIGQPGEIDWFRFIVSSAGTYTIETEGSTDVVMTLFGPNDQAAQVTEDDDSGQDRNARIVSNLTAGTYFLRIRHYQPTSTGSYRISVRKAQSQAPIPEIQVNGPAVQGEIAAANESDLYTFTASTTGMYTIQTEGNTDTFLTLFGPNNQTLRITQDDDSGAGLNSRIVADLAIGVYYARVRHYSPTGTGSYSIGVQR